MDDPELKEMLVSEGLLSAAQAEEVAVNSAGKGVSFQDALKQSGILSEEDMVKADSLLLGVPYLDLDGYSVDVSLLELLPEQYARKFNSIPLFRVQDSITVAMARPDDIMVLDELRRITGFDNIDPVISAASGINKALDKYYAASSGPQKPSSVPSAQAGRAREEGAEEEAPVIRMVNDLISRAVAERASDVHIEPEEGIVRVRYRIDGILYESGKLHKNVQNAVISRIKVLSHLDIAENRKPQDGRMRFDSRDLDIRVSTFPTIHGENVVLRILDKSSVNLNMEELGLSGGEFRLLDKAIHNPNGIVLVTGPTGSGKTTTLYAALSRLNSMEKNIITIEDPVEYELPLIRQTIVNPKAGITFATGLRSILRQDPDIIMVGEIRDRETADVSIQAALTGHLVLSTLHTNDSASALTRLMDMGIEPFLVSSSVTAILAQRLVRKICLSCRREYVPENRILEELGAAGGEMKFYKGAGCPACKQSGFMGRIGIFELFMVNEEIRRMVESKCSADEIRRKALDSGMTTLRRDGLNKVAAGLTTPEEVLRATEIE